jgi:hypothetical protein
MEWSSYAHVLDHDSRHGEPSSVPKVLTGGSSLKVEKRKRRALVGLEVQVEHETVTRVVTRALGASKTKSRAGPNSKNLAIHLFTLIQCPWLSTINHPCVCPYQL